ncbi:MAG: hypothetical protein AAGB51_09460 [Planctomycetota bacterium]
MLNKIKQHYIDKDFAEEAMVCAEFCRTELSKLASDGPTPQSEADWVANAILELAIRVPKGEPGHTMVWNLEAALKGSKQFPSRYIAPFCVTALIGAEYRTPLIKKHSRRIEADEHAKAIEQSTVEFLKGRGLPAWSCSYFDFDEFEFERSVLLKEFDLGRFREGETIDVSDLRLNLKRRP